MENKSHALVTGAFILLLGALLVVVVAWFQGDRSESVSYTVVARAGVPGLNLKAPVKLQGLEIGKVEKIEFDPSVRRQILVTIRVIKTAPLTASTYAKLGYQGITGLSFIELADEPGSTTMLADAPRQIELKPSLIDQISTSAPKLIASLSDAAEKLNKLLGENNQKQLSSTLTQLGGAATHIAQLADDLRPAAGALPPLLKRADGVMQSAQASLHSIDGVVTEAGVLTRELRQRSVALDQIGLAASQLQTTTQRLDTALLGPNRPRSMALLEDFSQASRAVERAANDLGDQPQGLLFGRSPPPAGPGETGFDANRKGR